jgi:hypothetical protein
MSRYVFAILCSLWLCVLSSAASAQTKPEVDAGDPVVIVSEKSMARGAKLSITGRVVSATNVPLCGVWVTLDGDSMEEPRKALTDSFGRFAFEGVYANEAYILNVETDRYRFDGQSRLVILQKRDAKVKFVTDL